MINDTTIIHYTVYDTAVPKLLLRPVDSVSVSHADTGNYLLLCNDSIFAPYAADTTTVYRKSMFSSSQQLKQKQEPIMLNNSQNIDWMFFVIMALLSLMSIYINHIRFNLKDIFSSLFNQRVQGRVERENNVKIRNLIPMTGIYLAAIAAVVTRLTTSQLSMRLTVPEPLFYAALVGILIILLLFKGALIRLIGNVFNDSNSTLLYLTSGHLFYFVGGMILTPLLLFVYFADNAQINYLIIAAIVIAIVLIFRFIRGIQLILTNSKSSKLYLFYYLCILEIAPILVLTKILIK